MRPSFIENQRIFERKSKCSAVTENQGIGTRGSCCFLGRWRKEMAFVSGNGAFSSQEPKRKFRSWNLAGFLSYIFLPRCIDPDSLFGLAERGLSLFSERELLKLCNLENCSAEDAVFAAHLVCRVIWLELYFKKIWKPGINPEKGTRNQYFLAPPTAQRWQSGQYFTQFCLPAHFCLKSDKIIS